jgi:hypothetical protein
MGCAHTHATELANTDVSVYTLMKLLGHESMVTSQRYVDGARHREPRGSSPKSALQTPRPIVRIESADTETMSPKLRGMLRHNRFQVPMSRV